MVEKWQNIVEKLRQNDGKAWRVMNVKECNEKWWKVKKIVGVLRQVAEENVLAYDDTWHLLLHYVLQKLGKTF